jgi:hypothetical protein
VRTAGSASFPGQPRRSPPFEGQPPRQTPGPPSMRHGLVELIAEVDEKVGYAWLSTAAQRFDPSVHSSPTTHCRPRRPVGHAGRKWWLTSARPTPSFPTPTSAIGRPNVLQVHQRHNCRGGGEACLPPACLGAAAVADGAGKHPCELAVLPGSDGLKSVHSCHQSGGMSVDNQRSCRRNALHSSTFARLRTPFCACGRFVPARLT